MEVRNTSDLRRMLLETIADVKAGTMEPKTARTIATLSTTILQSAKLDLEYLRFAAREDSPQMANRTLDLVSDGQAALQKVA